MGISFATIFLKSSSTLRARDIILSNYIACAW